MKDRRCITAVSYTHLDRYKADEEITAVWIWAEEISDGIYDIYIGYA